MALSRVPGDDELFIGGVFTLRRKATLEETGITHVLSVLKFDFSKIAGFERYEHLGIDVDDMDDENLLCEFERAGSWIEKGLKEGKDGREGKVFIHCAMGKSRSVTIATAYLLRQYPHHTVTSALELIRQSRPIAEPNDGFMAQLELYKKMGCPRDIENHPLYQKWIFQVEVNMAVAAGMGPSNVRFEDEQTQEESQSTREVELRCKKCRRALATTPYIVDHSPAAAPNGPKPSTAGPISSLEPALSPAPTSSACTHHFLQPLSWMRPALEEGLLQGRLECSNPKCKAQLGRYAWQGLRCSCGVWVCPAFSVQKGRVDEMVKRRDAGSDASRLGSFTAPPQGAGIRLPPGMKKENL